MTVQPSACITDTFIWLSRDRLFHTHHDWGQVIKPATECSYLVVGSNAQVPMKKDFLEDLDTMEPKRRSRWAVEDKAKVKTWGKNCAHRTLDLYSLFLSRNLSQNIVKSP